MSAILSFLGGSAFRLIWEFISDFLKAKQEHAQQLDILRLQGEIDAANHARKIESIKLQADLGVREIAVKAEADMGRIEMEGWAGAVKRKTAGAFRITEMPCGTSGRSAG